MSEHDFEPGELGDPELGEPGPAEPLPANDADRDGVPDEEDDD